MLSTGDYVNSWRGVCVKMKDTVTIMWLIVLVLAENEFRIYWIMVSERRKGSV